MDDLENDVDQCIKVMDKGGIILYPTDTVWGIGCDATNAEAVDKIFRRKRRPDAKAMIVLVSDKNMLSEYVANPSSRVFDYLESANKPTTVIYPMAQNLPSNLVASDGSIAIRIVKDVFCQALLRKFNKPIVSTSANISGEPVGKNFAQVIPDIKRGVDYIVHHRRDDISEAVPSSLIKWENDQPLIIRP